MEATLQNRIRERAYELWNAGGRTHGRAEEHWLAAEREVLAQMSAQACAERAAKPVRQKRSLTNVRLQPKKVAKAS